MMRHRPHLVGAAMSLFALVRDCQHARGGDAVHQSPVLAATGHDDHIGDGQHHRRLRPSRSHPITGLPAFCRVTATLTPTSDSNIKIEVWLPEKTKWNGRFLGTGGGGFQGVITYSELASGIQAGFAATNSDLGTGSSGCNPLYCGSYGNMGNPLAIAFGDPAVAHRRACSAIPSGSKISATGRST